MSAAPMASQLAPAGTMAGARPTRKRLTRRMSWLAADTKGLGQRMRAQEDPAHPANDVHQRPQHQRRPRPPVQLKYPRLTFGSEEWHQQKGGGENGRRQKSVIYRGKERHSAAEQTGGRKGESSRAIIKVSNSGSGSIKDTWHRTIQTARCRLRNASGGVCLNRQAEPAAPTTQ